MDDISAAISQVLSDPEKMRQVQSLASSLGLGGDGQGDARAGSNLPATQNTAAAGGSLPASGGGVDLSALGGLLSSLGIGGGNTSAGNTSPADLLSGLSGISGLTNTGASQAPGSTFDVGGLAGLLRSGSSASDTQSASGGFDMGVLLKLQQAMANLATNRSNIELLLALKPRLSDVRAKKIDDAIRVMQIIHFLPLLKETGLFGQMDGILGSLGNLGGFGNLSGGLGGILGNLSGGLGGLLGNLTGRR
jgi:hypothetical protein